VKACPQCGSNVWLTDKETNELICESCAYVPSDKELFPERARLIAAAPELLAALETALDDLKHYASTHGPGPDRRLAACEQAIAKARGEVAR
jgi:DNA-directed RNA polymerase subunit M/transcription elongation factor TFIIS